MTAFVGALIFTLGVSFYCSLLESFILSTTVAEIEDLKKRLPKRGRRLESLRIGLSETISTILTLNTIANTLGATLVGGLATKLFGQVWLGVVSGGLTLAILIFSEVIPKNLGVAYRVQLQPLLIGPLHFLRLFFRPINWLCGLAVRLIIRRPVDEGPDRDEEILLLAEKGAKEGTLTRSESSIIANALRLDDVRIGEIMTPRTVVSALNRASTVDEVLRDFKNLPFARLPVYEDSIDQIVGLVRRRDLLKAMANDQHTRKVEELMQEVHFIPETVSAAAALQFFLKTHQQLVVVVDEFGSMAGVLTMEDVIEHILGREIFEKDDLAVDMRELARARHQRQREQSARKTS
ncbi:MAG: HlyC/CorC family transporter [Puniceicoccaceae bacterium]|nr:MAG: HlyC/CorC family transporter [Puniceicoccaceae bacterium]